MRSVVQRLRQNAECKADNGLSMPKHEIVCLTLPLSHMMLRYIALCLSIVRLPYLWLTAVLQGSLICLLGRFFSYCRKA